MFNKVPAILFADDVVLISTSISGLQRQLDKVDRYCEKWNLVVNIKKTKIVVFKRGAKLKRTEQWRYKGEDIQVVKQFQYLGLSFSFNNLWNTHLADKAINCNYIMSRLLTFVYKHKECSLNLFLKLFDSLISSSMLYGAEIFAFSPKIDILERIERKFYRRVLGIPNGIPGVALNLLLNRIGIAEKSKIRSLLFWHTSNNREDSHLGTLALQQQTEWGNRGLQSWGLNIKNLIQKSGFAFIWEAPRAISRGKFKNSIKRRLADISKSAKMVETKKFKSANYLSNENLKATQNRIYALKSQ